MNDKVKLIWIDKDKQINIEPKILIERKDLSNTVKDENTENMLIHGDNLLALKALEKRFVGKVKCIYIDPPYNTRNKFEYYDDNLEQSTWLSLMKTRLEILRNLLTDDGSIFIQIDDEEYAYLKVLCDEIFGRKNYINTISVLMKNIAGASGGGEDKRLKKNIEYIIIYTKDYKLIKQFKSVYSYSPISKLVEEYRESGKSHIGYDISKKDFFHKYIIQSPEEVLKNNVGVCWDMTELERDFCEKNKIPCKCYFALVNEDDNTHTFLTFEDKGKLFYFERSWDSFKGIYQTGNLEEVFDVLTNNFKEQEKLSNCPKIKRISFYEYPKPTQYHLDCVSFQNYCIENGKLFYII